ncbi:MAG: sigma-70 family RNA polymerase sigma factor [Isosphaeraceae bacterium]
MKDILCSLHADASAGRDELAIVLDGVAREEPGAILEFSGLLSREYERFARALLKSRPQLAPEASTCDILQEAAIRSVKRWARTREVPSGELFKVMIYGIVIDRLDRAAVRRRAGPDRAEAAFRGTADDTAGPHTKAARAELAEALRAAIALLPVEDQVLIKLRYQGDGDRMASFREIAEALRLSEPTVRYRIEKLRKSLAIRLKSHAPTE